MSIELEKIKVDRTTSYNSDKSTLRYDSITYWQEGDGYKDDWEEPNEMEVDVKDDFIVIKTSRFSLGISDLKDLIALIERETKLNKGK